MARSGGAAAKVRILIADDHAIVREGIRMILGGQTDFEVIGEAADGEDAVRLARELAPDVVVMDNDRSLLVRYAVRKGLIAP